MRLTLHLVTPRDFVAFAAALREARLGRFERELGKHAPGVDPVELTARALAVAGDRPRLRAEYFAALGEDPRTPPGVIRPWILWQAIQAHAELVHAPPSGTWGYFGSPAFVPVQKWLRRMPSVDGDPRHYLVRRYLSAFGPASSADVASWSGVTNLRSALTALEPGLRRFRDEGGRLLFDLRRAKLAAGDEPAPVRFLPKWDTSILGYAPPERRRILPERHRKTVIKVNGDVAQTILVDGLIAGIWEIERARGGATLHLSPFGRLARDSRAELEDEGERLLRFVDPDARSYAVR
jgi:Winged helix DNA-binding domain